MPQEEGRHGYGSWRLPGRLTVTLLMHVLSCQHASAGGKAVTCWQVLVMTGYLN